MKRRYSVGLWSWGRLSDRFTTAGYREGMELLAAIKEAARIPRVSGVELTHPDDVNEDNWKEVQRALEDEGLRVSSIYCNLSSHPKWQNGAFTSRPELRQQAISQVKRTMDLAAEFGCGHITFSLLQDGWDYPFQVDYVEARKSIVKALRECCDHRDDVTVGIEYKPREPRAFCFLATAPLVLLLIKEVARENLGVVLDVGHALMARENMGDTVALIGEHGKLVHLHLNDNYRSWDDDLIVGSVHFIETLELLYWLRRIDYRGWYGLDIFPFREDPTAASSESIEFLETCQVILDEIGMDNIAEMLKEGDPTKTLRLIREKAFGRRL